MPRLKYIPKGFAEGSSRPITLLSLYQLFQSLDREYDYHNSIMLYSIFKTPSTSPFNINQHLLFSDIHVDSSSYVFAICIKAPKTDGFLVGWKPGVTLPSSVVAFIIDFVSEFSVD